MCDVFIEWLIHWCKWISDIICTTHMIHQYTLVHCGDIIQPILQDTLYTCILYILGWILDRWHGILMHTTSTQWCDFICWCLNSIHTCDATSRCTRWQYVHVQSVAWPKRTWIVHFWYTQRWDDADWYLQLYRFNICINTKLKLAVFFSCWQPSYSGVKE